MESIPAEVYNHCSDKFVSNTKTLFATTCEFRVKVSSTGLGPISKTGVCVLRWHVLPDLCFFHLCLICFFEAYQLLDGRATQTVSSALYLSCISKFF
jgi:hypothetical protein